MTALSGTSGLASGLALTLIGFYQRWISPRKGFRCAHAVLHGGPGCSGFAKQAIHEHGVWAAIGAIRGRFRECRLAMDTLLSQQNEPLADEVPEKPAKRNRRKKPGFCHWTDVVSCLPSSCGSCAGSKSGIVAGAGAGAGAEASTGLCAGCAGEGAAGVCGGIGEGALGACSGIAGGISCCG